MDLNSNIKQKNRKICIVFMIFIAVAFVGRVILIRFDIDPVSNLYVNSSWLILSFDYVITIAVVSLYILSFFIYRRKMQDGSVHTETTDYVFQGTQTLVYSSSLTGFMLTASSVLQGFYFFQNYNKSVAFSAYLTDYIKNDTLNFALFFISILASVYFFKTAAMNPTTEMIMLKPDIMTDKSDETETVQAPQFSQGYIFFSFFAIIWSFINIFQCFFDMSKSVNSSIRIYELMSFLFTSLYFVAESRLIIGRLEVSKFFTFAYISMLLISLSALPNLILSSFWILQTPTSIMTYAVQITFLLYIFARVYSQLKYSRFSYTLLSDLNEEQNSKSNQENSEQPEQTEDKNEHES